MGVGVGGYFTFSFSFYKTGTHTQTHLTAHLSHSSLLPCPFFKTHLNNLSSHLLFFCFSLFVDSVVCVFVYVYVVSQYISMKLLKISFAAHVDLDVLAEKILYLSGTFLYNYRINKYTQKIQVIQ